MKKLSALLEVSFFLLVFILIGAARRAFLPFTAAELELLGWSYSGGLVLILLPLAWLLLTRRSLPEYGLTLRNWQFGLEAGLTGYVARLIPWAGGTALMLALGTSYLQPLGAAILISAYLFAIIFTFTTLARRERTHPQGESRASARNNLLVLGGLLLFPILIALVKNSLTLKLVSTVLWQFVFSGFGEELLWRGFVQSRLNAVFGRPWKVLGVPFGAGALIASALFGLWHTFNTYDIYTGIGALNWSWGAWTVVSGFLAALLREKTGGLIASTITHGAANAVGEALNLLFRWF